MNYFIVYAIHESGYYSLAYFFEGERLESYSAPSLLNIGACAPSPGPLHPMPHIL
jgi:hypothetical protein